MGARQDRYETVMALKILDLFSGIGGFSYAAERLVGGYETVGFCEIDPFCQKVLKKHWPDVPIHEDVRKLANEADRYRGLVDVVCGGYPCQGFSVAGARKGQEDDRYLWPEMLRIIQAARPRFVIGENVAGHITLGLDTVLSDLAAEDYTARAFVIPACAKDARHRRDRVWVVAHSNSNRQSDVPSDEKQRSRELVAYTSGGKCKPRAKEQGSLREVSENRREYDYSRRSGKAQVKDAAHTDYTRRKKQRRPKSTRTKQQTSQCGDWWQPEPDILRVAYGIPNRMDRIKSLGNSIVPQVVAEIFIAIKAMADGQEKQG